MNSNYHSHCSYCDGKDTMENFIRQAIENKLNSYGFTSHAPVPFPNKWAIHYEDIDNYRNDFFSLKEKYKELIDLFIGLEVDYIPNIISTQSSHIKKYNWDYLIGSIHHIDFLENMPWNFDGSLEDFKIGLSNVFDNDIKKCTKRFFELTNEMLEIGGFDIIGHFDKIHLYAKFYNDFDYNSTWYRRYINETLDLIKQKNVIIEINTKSYIKKNDTCPSKYIYKEILEKKIPITVNSDCHYPTKMIDGFKETYTILKEMGFENTLKRVENKWIEDKIM